MFSTVPEEKCLFQERFVKNILITETIIPPQRRAEPTWKTSN